MYISLYYRERHKTCTQNNIPWDPREMNDLILLDVTCIYIADWWIVLLVAGVYLFYCFNKMKKKKKNNTDTV